jgi:hypothetical protein
MLDMKENEIVTLTAADGSTAKMEYMTSVDYEGVTYAAFYPDLEEDEDILDADYDMIILRVTETPDGPAFDLLEEDEEELEETLGEIFMEKIFGEETI